MGKKITFDTTEFNDPILSIKHLKKDYGTNGVLKDVSLDVNRGECIVIIGPSGSGKSTFLRTLNLLEEPTSGEIFFKGINTLDKHVDRNNLRKHMSMVFQHFDLFNNKNVLENCVIGQTKVLKRKKDLATNFAKTNLSLVGMSDRMYYKISEISGGQKQRVAIARSLSMSPDIILFDEPTSALDPEMVQGVLQVMKDVAKSGMTTVVVTHEMNFARDVADKVVFMADGVIQEIGSPQYIFNECKNERLLKFIGKLDN